MLGTDSFDDDAGGTVFRDVIMLALAGFVVIVMLLLPHLNPPAEAAKQPVEPPGNVVVEVRWPDTLDTDVDLWVEAPEDSPVGYSNKGGKVFNLLRDDRGFLNDASDLNYEVSYSRGVPSGEYTVNLHLYSSRVDITGPIPISVVVSVKRDSNAPARQILTSKTALSHIGEETTVFRFALTSKGALVPDSVHNLFRALRSGR
jgi:hypothetical protein